MNIALIPARGSSKRIHQKNLQQVGGLSLIQHAVVAAKMVPAIEKIIVSTDSDEISRHVREKESGVFLWNREAAAATDEATDRDVMLDLLHRWPEAGQVGLIVYLRPTTPVRRIIDIETAVEIMTAVPAATGLRSVHEMSESAYKCFEIEGGRLMPLPCLTDIGTGVDLCNEPNHHYPKTYHPNGVVDIVKPKTIATGATFGTDCMAHVTPPTIEIDTPFDLEMARLAFSHRQYERVIYKR